MAVALRGNRVPSRRWCLTIADEDTWRALVDIDEHVWPEDVRFLIGQFELGDSGFEHFQAYLELVRPQRFSWIKNWLGDDTVHCEIAAGSAGQNIAYCSKEPRIEGPWTYGEPSAGQGSRTDIDGVKDLIDAGFDDLAVAGTYFATWCRYHRGFDKYRQAVATRLSREGREPPVVTVFWGGSGTGKSHRAFAEASPGAWWFSPPTCKGGPCWFDGYEGQPDVVIDDFDGECIPLQLWLRLLDKWPLQLAVKGGFVPCQFQRIWITSNVKPEDWYAAVPPGTRRREAINRRLTHIHHLAVVHNIVNVL